MADQRLVALRPLRLSYPTRHLQAGDVFEVRDREARLLIQINRARMAAETETVKPSSESPLDLDALRAEAAELGVHVDGRWGEARLLEEIDAAKEARSGSSEE